MAQRVGTTDLRQRLTDILQAVREQRAAYVVETFGRPQAVLINLDPTIGVEQAGTRPVLVVQCDPANERIPTVTVVPLTANLRAGRIHRRTGRAGRGDGIPQFPNLSANHQTEVWYHGAGRRTQVRK